MEQALVETLPELRENPEKLTECVSFLYNLGVTQIGFLECFSEKDLLPQFNLVQARRLLIRAKQIATSTSSSNTTNMQWVHDFKVPWDKCQTGLLKSVKSKTAPTPWQRKELVHLTIDEILKYRVPDVIGLGVRKCGTGVFVKFLEKHGSFSVPDYYNYETEYFTRNYVKGLDWYKSLFKSAPSDAVLIEKTPHYYYAEPYDMAEQMLELNPKLKVYVMLCEPAARAYSCFVHENFDWLEKNEWVPFFERYVNYTLPRLQGFLENHSVEDQELMLMERWWRRSECLVAGLYSIHLNRWRLKFDESNFLIINGDEMLTNPAPVFDRFQDFVGVERRLRTEDWVKSNETGHFCLKPPDDRSKLYCLDDGVAKARTRNEMESTPTPSKEIMEMLREFYRPYNDMLYDLLGEDLKWD